MTKREINERLASIVHGLKRTDVDAPDQVKIGNAVACLTLLAGELAGAGGSVAEAMKCGEQALRQGDADGRRRIADLVASVREHESKLGTMPEPTSRPIDVAYQEALKARLAEVEAERDALLLDKDDLVFWIELAVRRLGEDGGGETTINNARGVLRRALGRYAPKPGAETKAWAERQGRRGETPPQIDAGEHTHYTGPMPNSGRFPTRPEFDDLKRGFEELSYEVAELSRLVASIRRDEVRVDPARNGEPA